MSDLRDLYQQVILDHSRRPHNFGEVEAADGCADGHNPLCGDKIHVSLRTDEAGAITDVQFQGSGCAISMASASMMTDAVRGRTAEQARALGATFVDLVTGRDGDAAADRETELGKLLVFGGVREFPVRIKCATLAWHTLGAALDRRAEKVTTE